MSFGNEADENECARMFARCRDVGINFFDCANNYSNSRAEEIFGQLIADCRDDIVIATKVTHRTGRDINAKEKNINPVTLAVSWVKMHPAVTAPIIGAINVEQLTASLDAADFDLSPDMRKKISSLSVQPANATDRLEENIDASFRLRH